MRRSSSRPYLKPAWARHSQSFSLLARGVQISLGNIFTALVNSVMRRFNMVESSPQYYLFFAGVLAVTTIIYFFVAARFKVETHLQEA